jgi:hypothetical protein
LLKPARVSFLTVADIKLELVDCQLLHGSELPYSDFSDASLTIRATCHEFRYERDWRQFQYWLNCTAYMDDNLEFHPWPKKGSKILLEGLLLGFSGNRAIELIEKGLQRQEQRDVGCGRTWPV